MQNAQLMANSLILCTHKMKVKGKKSDLVKLETPLSNSNANITRKAIGAQPETRKITQTFITI